MKFIYSFIFLILFSSTLNAESSGLFKILPNQPIAYSITSNITAKQGNIEIGQAKIKFTIYAQTTDENAGKTLALVLKNFSFDGSIAGIAINMELKDKEMPSNLCTILPLQMKYIFCHSPLIIPLTVHPGESSIQAEFLRVLALAVREGFPIRKKGTWKIASQEKNTTESYSVLVEKIGSSSNTFVLTFDLRTKIPGIDGRFTEISGQEELTLNCQNENGLFIKGSGKTSYKVNGLQHIFGQAFPIIEGEITIEGKTKISSEFLNPTEFPK